MKKIGCLLLIVVFILSINSCREELMSTIGNPEELEALKSSDIYEKEKKEYDNNMRKITKSLAKSLKNKELRKLIKEEAMLQVDGDYDIIWKNFKYKKVKTDKGEMELEELIAENIDEKDKTKAVKRQELENFGNKYKKLQVAVPVHCENWDVENVEPIITYIPADFEETWKEIEAFDLNGKKIKLKTNQVPNLPIIVVGLNERSDDNGDVLEEYNNLKMALIPPEGYVPPTPINLTGQAANFSIVLSWSMPSGSDLSLITHYNIYRKPEGGVFSSNPIGATHDKYDMVFYDTTVEPSKTYSYYVNANCGAESSPSSNTVTVSAPGYSEAVSNFEAVNNGYGEIFLSWANSSQYKESTNLYRRIVQANSDWDENNANQTFYSNESYFLDRYLTPGKRYHYMIINKSPINGGSYSDAKFDFVQIPYRNINGSNPVTIRIIEVAKLKEVEPPFLMGAPEFRITVGNGSKITGASSNIVTNRKFDFDAYGLYKPVNFTSEIFPNYPENKLFDWNPLYWEDVVSIKVIELDEHWLNKKFVFDIPINTLIKNEKVASILPDKVNSTLTTLDKNSEDCGTDYLYFYDRPIQYLDAYSYGVELTISDRTD